MNKLQKALDDLSKLHPKVIDLSLGRLLNLLEKLDNPHKKLPPIIHIAGTNGKGSTQAFLKSVFNAHGKSSHAYISPHLVRFNERIEIKGKPIDDDNLMALIDEVKIINKGEAITFFEVTTAIAFLAFSRINADYLILEVGLGGRFDATNVIEKPIATAITPISIDHEEFLGSDITKIAGEKAGILKENIPSFWSKQQDLVLKELKKQALQKSVAYAYQGKDWTIDNDYWVKDNFKISLQNLGLQGEHQKQNAALALSVVQYVLQEDFNENYAKQGLQKAFWPGRLQKVKEGRFKSLLPQHDIYLDGAHNPHGAEILAKYVKDSWQDKPVYLLWAMLNNRDASLWLKAFEGIFSEVITLPLSSTPNGHKPKDLKKNAEEQGYKASAFEDMTLAFEYLSTQPQGRILMAGSLYMLGEFLSANECGYKDK